MPVDIDRVRVADLFKHPGIVSVRTASAYSLVKERSKEKQVEKLYLSDFRVYSWMEFPVGTISLFLKTTRISLLFFFKL